MKEEKVGKGVLLGHMHSASMDAVRCRWLLSVIDDLIENEIVGDRQKSTLRKVKTYLLGRVSTDEDLAKSSMDLLLRNMQEKLGD